VRASSRSYGSSCLAACSSNGAASLPKPETKATWPRSRSARAFWNPVERGGLRRGQQPQHRVERPGLEADFGRGQRPLPTPRRVHGQRHRPLQERGRRGQPAARLGPAGRALELGGDLLVGPEGGLSPVPGPAVGIRFLVGGLGQGPMHRLALLRRRRPVGRRPHQRMPKQHPGADLQQGGLGRRARGLSRDPQSPGGTPQQHRVADRIGRRQLQQPPGVGWQDLEPPPEAGLDPPRQRHRAGNGEPTGQLGRRHPPGQLQQRQRVAACLGHEPAVDPRIQRPGEHRVQQGTRIGLPQALDHQLWQPAQLVARDARREDQADRLGLQAASHKPKDLGGGTIQPLRVID
jgi:hypothetical protein